MDLEGIKDAYIKNISDSELQDLDSIERELEKDENIKDFDGPDKSFDDEENITEIDELSITGEDKI